jgi:D-alanine transaminase
MTTQPMCLPTVFLSGEFMPFEQAKISPLDRGFIFADGCYEVIPVYGGVPLRFEAHMKRLGNGLAELSIDNPYSLEQWESIITTLVEKNGGGDQAVYFQVTRGVAKRDFSMPKGLKQTVFMMSNPLPLPKAEIYEKGISCVSLDDFRWERGHIKSVALLGAILLKNEANLAGADECVLFRDGFLTESSASNIAAVKNGVILCPPLDNLILHGITYELMIDLARKAGLPLEIRRVSRKEVRTADELWISSSTKEVVPITMLDGKPVGNGQPGPMFKKMYQLFQDYKKTLPKPMARAAE